MLPFAVLLMHKRYYPCSGGRPCGASSHGSNASIQCSSSRVPVAVGPGVLRRLVRNRCYAWGFPSLSRVVFHFTIQLVRTQLLWMCCGASFARSVQVMFRPLLIL